MCVGRLNLQRTAMNCSVTDASKANKEYTKNVWLPNGHSGVLKKPVCYHNSAFLLLFPLVVIVMY
jgi:hypothetical protein